MDEGQKQMLLTQIPQECRLDQKNTKTKGVRK